MRTIWLPKDLERKEIIEKNEIIITDENRYLEIMNLLKDYRNYIASKRKEGSEKYLEMSIEEIHRAGLQLIYENGNLGIYDRDYDYPYYGPELIAYLNNPRANLLVFMENLKSTTKDELPLGLKSLVDLHPLEYVEKIFDLSQIARITNEETIQLLEELSPQITLFSTEVLNCIDFVQVESIDVNELKEKIEWCEKAIESSRDYINKNELKRLCSEYKKILFQVELAHGNMEVLTLARKINKLC